MLTGLLGLSTCIFTGNANSAIKFEPPMSLSPLKTKTNKYTQRDAYLTSLSR